MLLVIGYTEKTSSSKWKAIKTLTNGNITSYVDSELTPGTQYFYTVKAYRKLKSETIWGSYNTKGVYAVTGLATPKVTKVYYGKTTGTVDVSWNKVPGAQYYEVYLKQKNGSWMLSGKSKGNKATIATSIDKTLYYTVRACVKYSGKIYRSSYNKNGYAFCYEEYGNPYIDYSVFDIISPSETKLELEVGDSEYIEIDSDFDELSYENNDEDVAYCQWEDAENSGFLLSIHAVSEGTTTIRLYNKKYPNIYKNITVIVNDYGNNTADNELVMAAIGIQNAYNSAKFPSSLHIRNIAYEQSLFNAYGDNISRLVVHAYATNSFGGYGDIYSVVIRTKTNTHYPDAFEYNGYYYSTSSYAHDPGMKGIRVDNGQAVDMWQYLYESNFEIPYD